MFPLRLATIIGILLLSGCLHDGELDMVENFSLQDGSSVSLRADRRAILTTKLIDDNGNARYIFCAEPSPDVFSAVLSAFTASLKFDSLTRGGSGIQRSKLSSEIPTDVLKSRNQTIQLMRDGLYRTCEAYAAGVLDRHAYSSMVGQYQSMITVLFAINVLASSGECRGPHSNRINEEFSTKKSSSGANVEDEKMTKAKSLCSERKERIVETTAKLIEKVLEINIQRPLQIHLSKCVSLFGYRPDVNQERKRRSEQHRENKVERNASDEQGEKYQEPHLSVFRGWCERILDSLLANNATKRMLETQTHSDGLKALSF